MSPAVSDTSPLTNLAVIGRLDLAKEQLHSVNVPERVWAEMTALPHAEGRAALRSAADAGWLRGVELMDQALPASPGLFGLHAGESEAIALAHEQSALTAYIPHIVVDEQTRRGNHHILF